MTTRKKIVLILITALLCFAVIFFNNNRNAGKVQPGKIFIYAVPVKTIYGWGYNIQRNYTGIENPQHDSIYIRQEYMPAVAHKIGFSSSADAKKVGDIVVQKIMARQLPSMSVKELKQLGVFKDSL